MKSAPMAPTRDALADNAAGMAGEGFVPTSRDYKKSGSSFGGFKKA